MGRILEGCREDVKRQPHSYWSTVRLPAEAETKLDVDVIERIALTGRTMFYLFSSTRPDR
jgi:hypothetical protein